MNFNNIISRKCLSVPLSELIDDEHFHPYKPQDQGNCRETSNKKYRIPEHQRFNDRWDKTMHARLIESVMWDFPIHAMVMSKHHGHDSENNVIEYFNIQDGQQRLTTLYNFMHGKCNTTYEDKTFAEFSVDEKAKFRAYAVPCQEISKKSGNISQEMYANALTHIFERLNSGKALSDNEKYHARRGSSLVKYATLDLPNLPGLKGGFETFIGAIGTGQGFKMLGEMVGAVLTIIKGSSAHLTTSFMRNCECLALQVSDADKEKVQSIFADWFRILNLAHTNDNSAPMNVKSLKIIKRYGKLSGPISLFIFWKIKQAEQTEVMTDECWVWTIQNWNFEEFQDNVFRELSSNAWGMRNLMWAGDEGLKKKLDALVRYYRVQMEEQCNIIQLTPLRMLHATNYKNDNCEDDNMSELSTTSVDALEGDVSSVAMGSSNSGSLNKRIMVKRVSPKDFYKCFDKDTRLKLEITKANTIYGKVSVLSKRIISNTALTYEKNGTKYENATLFTSFNDWLTCYMLHIGGKLGKKSAYNAIYYENEDGEWESIDELTRL